MSCGWSFFILIAARADITRYVRGLCQNSSLDILQNSGSSAGRCFVGGSGCFCFSCPARTVMFQLLYLVTASRVVNKRISKRKVSVQHSCEDKVLLAAKPCARGIFAISIYNLDTEMQVSLTLWKSSLTLSPSSFGLAFCCEEMPHSRNPEVQRVEAEGFLFVCVYRLVFSSLAAGHLALVFCS